MIYDKYKARILALAKAWETVKRFRVLILSCILAVTSIVAGLLAARGAVIEDKDFPTQIAYGEWYEYDAKAFMSDVYYEYCVSGTGNWSSEKPTKPGEYMVRAVAKAAFGGTRYGKAHVFTVTPRKIEVTVVETEIVYGELPTITADTVSGDTISCSNFVYEGIGTDMIDVRPVDSSIKVENADGIDVTSCYVITTKQTVIDFLQRPITVTAGSANREYNGSALTSNEYVVTEGSVADGDDIAVSCSGAVTTVGSVFNQPSVQFFKDDLDVTQYYAITTVNGVLEVKQRPILIKTPSAEREYDGTPLFDTAYDAKHANSQIVQGHTIEVSSYAQLVNVGSAQNTLTLKIFDAAGTDMTSNYAISYPEDSMLTVKPRAITVTSEDNLQLVYNAKAQKHELFQITDGSLAGGDTLTELFTAAVSTVAEGEKENVFTVTIENTEEKDVTSNYSITYEYGKISVIKREISITTDSATRAYTGEYLQAQGATGENLVDGHKLDFTQYPKILTIGTLDNVPESQEVLDEKGVPVTENYTIVPVYGVLEITKRLIDVTVKDAEKTYDGTPLTANDVEVKVVAGIDEWTDIRAQHTWSATTRGSQTAANLDGSINELDTLTILCGAEDRTENFEIVHKYAGKLIVKRRPVYLISVSADFVYSDTACSAPQIRVGNNHDAEGTAFEGLDFYALVDGHETITSDWQSITDVGEMENSFTATIVDGNKQDVSSNYAIYRGTGKVKVYPRKIKIQRHSCTWVYDGNFHSDLAYDIPDTPIRKYTQADCVEETNANILNAFYKPVAGHTLAYATNNKVRNVMYDANGNVTFTWNLVELKVMKGEENVSKNYEISYVKNVGTLTIMPREITVQTESLEKDYDGTQLSSSAGNMDAVEIISGTLATGQFYRTIIRSSQTNAYDENNINQPYGQCENEITLIVLDDGVDVSANYKITYEYGTLRVNRLEFSIKTRSLEFVYNGTKQCDDWVGTDNYTSQVVPLRTGQTSVLPNKEKLWAETGTYVLNVADSNTYNAIHFVFRDAGGKDTSRNYLLIDGNQGLLKVLPRKIEIQLKNREWLYDSRAHYDGDGSVLTNGATTNKNSYTHDDITTAYDTLLEMHWLEIQTPQTAHTITNVKQSGMINTVTVYVYDGMGRVDVVDGVANYLISYTEATLKIIPRTIVLQADSESKIYNGQLQRPEYDKYQIIGGDGLVGGHIAKVTTFIDGLGIINVADGPIAVHVRDDVTVWAQYANGTQVDVTDNYNIERVDGEFSILPRPILINTNDVSWVYDGEGHADKETDYTDTVQAALPTYYALVDGHRVESYGWSFITFVWQNVDNEILFHVLNADGEVMDDNYVVKVNPGKLTITPRPITVQTHTLSWVYDNQKHYDDIAYSSTDLIITAGCYALADGDFFFETLNPTEITYVTEGIKQNKLKLSIRSDWYTGTEDITQNYAIEYEFGTLSITPRKILLESTADRSWEYDGKPHCDDTVYLNENLLVREGETYSLIEGHNLVIDGATYITNVKESGKQNVLTFLVKDGIENYTPNYIIGIDTYGVLEITPRVIWVASASMSMHYNAETITIAPNTWEVRGEEGRLLAEHTLELPTAGVSGVDVGEYAHVITGEVTRIYNKETNEDVTDNYKVAGYHTGSLYILPRYLQLNAKGATKEYDGTPLVVAPNSFEIYDIVWEPAKLVTDLRIEGVTTTGAETTDVGKVENAFTVSIEEVNDVIKIYDLGGRDVTKNYAIKVYLPGYAEVTPRKITLASLSAEKQYDGTPLTSNKVLQCTQGSILEQHTCTAVITGSQTEVGKSANTIEDIRIFDTTTLADVAHNYEITKEEGTLTVTGKAIAVYSGSAKKSYDGMPLTEPYWDYDKSALLDGHRIDALTNGSRTEVGKSDNTFEYIIIYDENDNEVTNTLYIIQVIFGELEVVPEDDEEEQKTWFYVTTNRDGTIYLRRESKGAYNATTGVWSSVPAYTESDISPLYFTGLALKNKKVDSYSVTLTAADDYKNRLPYYVPYYVDSSKSADTSDTSLTIPGGWSTYTLDYYAYGGYDLSLAGTEYEAAEIAYRTYVYNNYCALPSSTEEYMRTIIAENGWKASDRDIIDKVANYVQNAATYNLDFDRTLETSGDIAVNFLRDYKEGVCRHYASSATAIFRTLGIPARYTTGYAAYVAADTVAEFSNIGHAWVEVYVDGMGWVNVEVTGTSPNGNVIPKQEEITVKPKDFIGSYLHYSSYDASTDENMEIVDVDGKNDLSLLLAQGYYYEAEVEGSLYGVGEAESTITSFTLYDNNGNIVSGSKYKINYVPGRICITSGGIVKIMLESGWKYYDGTPYSYTANSFWMVMKNESHIEDGAVVSFDITSVPAITDVGVMETSVLRQYVKVIKNGEDITDTYEIEFITSGLEVRPREITIAAINVEKIYDGKPLTSDEAKIVFGNLVAGHTFKVYTSGTITDIGKTENIIVSYDVFDANGMKVTRNYKVATQDGTLTVLP